MALCHLLVNLIIFPSCAEVSVLDAAREKLCVETTRGSGDHAEDSVERVSAGVPLPRSAGSEGRSGSAGSRKSSAGKSSRTSKYIVLLTC